LFGHALSVVREGAEADRMVKHLADKGYAAYVVAPAAGSTPVYRVRVGKFKSRAQAETVKRKLEKEEQYKPWIIR
jgi:cell division septation protein DedD